jgi:hypothetical protein
MSGAKDLISILFFAIQASIVTSAIATPAVIPIKQLNATAIGTLPRVATINAETQPRTPATKKYGLFYIL